MNTVRTLGYHGLAALAILAHVILVGLSSLLLLVLTSPPGAEIPALALKGVVIVSWLGLGWLGLLAWTRRSRLVVVVPIASFAILWVVGSIGNELVHWSLIYLSP